VEKVTADGTSGKGKIVMINGSPTDANAAQFKKGAHAALDGKVQIGPVPRPGSAAPPRPGADSGVGLPDPSEAFMASRRSRTSGSLVGKVAVSGSCWRIGRFLRSRNPSTAGAPVPRGARRRPVHGAPVHAPSMVQSP
jgi:hypothetical protein